MFQKFQYVSRVLITLTTCLLITLIFLSIASDNDVNISVPLILLLWLVSANQFNNRTIDFYYPTLRKPDSLIMYLLSYQRLILHFLANALKYVCVVYIVYALLYSFYEHRYEQTSKAIPDFLHIIFGPLFFVLAFMFIVWYYAFISGQLDKEENANLLEISKYPIVNWLVFALLILTLTIYPSILIDKYFISRITNPDEHYYYKLSRKVIRILNHNNLFQSATDFTPFGWVFLVGLVTIMTWAMLIGLAEGQKIKKQLQVR